MGAAEADLQILRARQAAATEKARSEALVQAELDENVDHASNDHASQFHAKISAAVSSPVFVTKVPPVNPTK